MAGSFPVSGAGCPKRRPGFSVGSSSAGDADRLDALATPDTIRNYMVTFHYESKKVINYNIDINNSSVIEDITDEIIQNHLQIRNLGEWSRRI